MSNVRFAKSLASIRACDIVVMTRAVDDVHASPSACWGASVPSDHLVKSTVAPVDIQAPLQLFEANISFNHGVVHLRFLSILSRKSTDEKYALPHDASGSCITTFKG